MNEPTGVNGVTGAKLDMHILEDDKRFKVQHSLNADLYSRIDGINFKLWAIMLCVGILAGEKIVSYVL